MKFAEGDPNAWTYPIDGWWLLWNNVKFAKLGISHHSPRSADRDFIAATNSTSLEPGLPRMDVKIHYEGLNLPVSGIEGLLSRWLYSHFWPRVASDRVASHFPEGTSILSPGDDRTGGIVSVDFLRTAAPDLTRYTLLELVAGMVQIYELWLGATTRQTFTARMRRPGSGEDFAEVMINVIPEGGEQQLLQVKKRNGLRVEQISASEFSAETLAFSEQTIDTF